MLNNFAVKISSFAGILLLFSSSLPAEVQLPAIFAESMVLQRGRSLPVYGKAAPGEKVVVEFAGQRVETSTAQNGVWETPLAPLEASTEPRGYFVPTALFNAMIAPYTETPLRGFLWYQGESNAGRYKQHDILFPTLIRSWRNLWGDDSLPFYFVQLAAYRKREKEPSSAYLAFMRESQAKALSLPLTGMAVTIDIGDATNVHPKNKQDVGKRLALWACRDCYGDKDIAVSGPLYASNSIEDNKIRIRFTYVSDGLKAKGGELKGVAIAGADKKFVWADAEIDGDTVLVWSDEIPNPAYVRYAWANNPECTLVNNAGLPAVPFRTDSE